MDTYFESPVKLDPKTFRPLKYYTTYSAIKSYTAWLKKRQNLPPDSEYHLNQIRNSLKFMITYCTDNNIQWDDFLVSDNLVPHWVQQLKEHRISIYTLMGYTNLRQELDRLPDDIKALYIQNISDNYVKFKQSYLKSATARPFVEQGFIKCKKFVSRSGI